MRRQLKFREARSLAAHHRDCAMSPRTRLLLALAITAGLAPFSVMAQDVEDAKKFNAKLFTAHVAGYKPEQVIDFVQVFLHRSIDNPDAGWRPLRLKSRSPHQLRFTQASRTWGSVNALEFDVFAEADEEASTQPSTRLTLYFVAIQNRNSSAERREDVAGAAGMYRVAQSLPDMAEKHLVPDLERGSEQQKPRTPC